MAGGNQRGHQVQAPETEFGADSQLWEGRRDEQVSAWQQAAGRQEEGGRAGSGCGSPDQQPAQLQSAGQLGRAPTFRLEAFRGKD